MYRGSQGGTAGSRCARVPVAESPFTRSKALSCVLAVQNELWKKKPNQKRVFSFDFPFYRTPLVKTVSAELNLTRLAIEHASAFSAVWSPVDIPSTVQTGLQGIQSRHSIGRVGSYTDKLIS